MEPEKKTGFDASKPFVVPILSGRREELRSAIPNR